MKFEDMQTNPVEGADTMRLLGLGDNDLIDQVDFLKAKDVIDFFKDIPEKRYIINRITNGRPFQNNAEKINYVWGYVELKKSQATLQGHLSKAKSEYEKADVKMNQINRELSLFEK